MNLTFELNSRKTGRDHIAVHEENISPRKRLRNCDHSARLPSEILIHIFSYLSHEELYKIARCVCRRWYVLASSPTLWKKITAQNQLPSHILCNWLECSPLLKELILEDRKDIDTVTEKVSNFCRNLQLIKIENSKGTDSTLIKSKNLCRLLERCKFLNEIHFRGVKIRSCKFFKLLSKRKNFGINKRCSYNGPISRKQMQALLEAIVASETYEAATLLTSNKSIHLKEKSTVSNNSVNVIDAVKNIWDNIAISETIQEMNVDDDDDFDENYVP